MWQIFEVVLKVVDLVRPLRVVGIVVPLVFLMASVKSPKAKRLALPLRVVSLGSLLFLLVDVGETVTSIVLLEMTGSLRLELSATTVAVLVPNPESGKVASRE